MKAAIWIVLLAALGAGVWYHQGGDPGELIETARGWSDGLGGPEVRWQYVDDKGRVQIVASREEVPEQWRERAGRIEIAAVEPSVRKASSRAAAAGRAAPQEVVFYTAPGCVYCKRTKRWLDKHDVVYTERDVTEDRAAVDRLYRLSGQAVTPSVEVDGEVILGYNPDRLEVLLGG